MEEATLLLCIQGNEPLEGKEPDWNMIEVDLIRFPITDKGFDLGSKDRTYIAETVKPEDDVYSTSSLQKNSE